MSDLVVIWMISVGFICGYVAWKSTDPKIKPYISPNGYWGTGNDTVWIEEEV